MRSSRFLICAKTPAWAIAVRRKLPVEGFRVYETRSLDGSWQELMEHPASLLAVEVTAANLESVATWLPRMAFRFPHARVIVLGARGLERSQWLLRELGATHAIFSPRHLDAVVRIAVRHLPAVSARDAAFGGVSLRETVWDRLPWSNQG